MHPADFLRQLEDEKIVTAIGDAESRTSGQIRVWISHKNVSDPSQRRDRDLKNCEWRRQKIATRVLLYFAPRTRKFAIIGDTGVHEKCGAEFWTKVAAQLTHDIHEMPMTDAIINSIRTVGGLLAAHFPHGPAARMNCPTKSSRD